MTLPYFYIDNCDPSLNNITLDEDNSRHVVSVLRLKKGDRIHLTDGNGALLTAEITNDHKKHCEVKTVERLHKLRPSRKTVIGISLLKNAGRFEWFLEKATELGVTEIIPLLCERTEKQKFRSDRMKNILVSAMLQSRQFYLPVLNMPEKFDVVLDLPFDEKYIAHCIEDSGKTSISNTLTSDSSTIILIGPEGDFTSDEVALALQKKFIPVSLGNTRLRTETAGMAAAVLLSIGQYEK